MKQFFWLLLLINLGLFAYFNVDYILPSKQQMQVEEISPDKIQVLSSQQIDALSKKETTSAPPSASTSLPQLAPTATACFEWGIFSDANLANAQNVLAKLSLPATVKEQNSQQPKRFWVYRPPLKSVAEAQQRASEIRALGVQDLFVVQEPRWKNAISFGIFEDENLATKLLQELQAKGIKGVTKVLRSQGRGHSSLLLNNIAESDAVELKKLKPNFPEAELKEISCH